MSCYKDRLIEELKTENHALKHSPYSYDAASGNLRHAETTLAATLDDRARLDADLRNQEDVNTATINRLDGDRTHLMGVERAKIDEITALRRELAALRDDLAHRDAEFGHCRADNNDHKGHANAVSKELAHERAVNDGLKDELNHVNDQIAINIGHLKDKESRIAYLHRENDISRTNQGGLKGSIAGRTADCNAVLDQIADRNVKIDGLNRDIDHNIYTINDLRRKIDDEDKVTSHVNYDNSNYAVRNSDLNGLVVSLRIKLEDRERDIAALQRNIADLTSAYHSKQYDNDYKERNIYDLTTRIDSLSLDKKESIMMSPM